MKTLISALFAVAIASPVLAQEADRSLNTDAVRAQVTAPSRHHSMQPSVANAYASAGEYFATNGGTDPDAFIRSSLTRDAYTD